MATARSSRPKPEDGKVEASLFEDARPLATPLAGLGVAAPSGKPVGAAPTPFAGLGRAAPSGEPVEGAAPTPFAGLGRAAPPGKSVEGAAPTPFAGLGAAAPSGAPVDGHGLALDQMRLTIEDGLLMVFGPEGDPVPPQAFTAAAAAHPAALLDLPDGTTAPASRIAAVLRAQVLGRLGRSAQGTEWILAMLRESGRPEPASEDQLRAEQDAPGAVGAVESRLTVPADAGGIAAGAPPESDQIISCGCEQTAAAEADAAPAMPQVENAAAREVLDRASLGQAAASIEPSHDPAVLRLGPDRAKPASDAMPGAARSARVDAEDAPRDLSTRTSTQATRTIAQGSGPGSGPGPRQGAGAPGDTGDLRTRTAPRADHRGDPGARDRGAGDPDKRQPGPVQESRARAADPVAGAPGSRTVALGLNPQALEGLHALVIRDVPAGARLSAGAYDPALDGWLMRPQDLDTLTISAPPELRADFTVTVMGIALRPGDANAVRILAWLPVRIA